MLNGELTGTTLERILPRINETVQLCVGGKLTKFRGHEGINKKHESFYPRKFLAVRYSRHQWAAGYFFRAILVVVLLMV